MAYVFVEIEPRQLGAADTDYTQEVQQEADATMQAIIENSQAETETYELAQQQADRELFDNLPTTDAPKIKSMWPWLAAGAGVLLFIAIVSKD